MTSKKEFSNNIGPDLFERIRNNDKVAFELLFRRFYAPLCGFANKFLNNMSESEEIVEEVFCRIWENRHQLLPNGTAKPYLYKSVQNLCLNQISKQKTADKYSKIIQIIYKNSPENDFDLYEKLLATELETKLNVTIESLPEECRRIFKMSRFDELKYNEIAELLEISVKTVETQMSRALKKLRLEMKDYLTLLIIGLMINQ